MNGPLKRWTGRMTLRSDENPVDRLADDRGLEVLLRAEASRLERRAGLADRIFAASVGLLPARQRPVRAPWLLRKISTICLEGRFRYVRKGFL